MKKLSFAIIGGGPSAFYTAKLLSKLPKQPIIHIFEKQICPFGLIRYGVAPDHIAIKKMQNTLSEIQTYKYFSYIGNKQITSKEIEKFKQTYSGIIFANGALDDNKLGYQDMNARKLVYWYNSHPQSQNNPISLSGKKNISIIGNGNVAIDLARILLKNPNQLAKTDISEVALQQLKKQQVKKVEIIGRRGITQSAFSLKEVRQLKNCNIQLCAYNSQLQNSLTQSSIIESTDIGNNNTNLIRINRRKLNFINQNFTILDSTKDCESSQKKRIIFRFLLSPLSYSNNILKLTQNNLIGQPFHQKPVQTGVVDQIQTDLLISSIGFKSKPILNNQFNFNKNIIQNSNGCVMENNKIQIGTYAVGWVKTGANGVIDSTLLGSQQTMNNIRIHIQKNLIEQKEIPQINYKNTINFDKYNQILAEQIKKGMQKGKIREKLSSDQLKSFI